MFLCNSHLASVPSFLSSVLVTIPEFAILCTSTPLATASQQRIAHKDQPIYHRFSTQTAKTDNDHRSIGCISAATVAWCYTDKAHLAKKKSRKLLVWIGVLVPCQECVRAHVYFPTHEHPKNAPSPSTPSFGHPPKPTHERNYGNRAESKRRAQRPHLIVNVSVKYVKVNQRINHQPSFGGLMHPSTHLPSQSVGSAPAARQAVSQWSVVRIHGKQTHM